MRPLAVNRAAPARVDAIADDAACVVPEGTAPPVSIPAEIYTAAARAFAAGERLDVQQLAASLGISRATLYRRAGNREQLFAAVIWCNSRATLVEAVGTTSRRTASPGRSPSPPTCSPSATAACRCGAS
jgi:hypothetical protein